MIINLFKKILAIIYPATCIICQKIVSKESLFCKECYLKIKFISPIKCKICSQPLQIQKEFTDSIICLECFKKKPFFDFSYAIFAYNETIAKGIIDLKYHDRSYLAIKFANILKIHIKNIIEEVDYIASVAMHKKKLITRKYNQANLIARNLSNKKYFPQLLIRLNNDDSQVKLSKYKRQKNLNKAFIINPLYKNKIIGKKILLIDDVMTTNATLNACSKVLKKNGASLIYVAVIAKSIKNN